MSAHNAEDVRDGHDEHCEATTSEAFPGYGPCQCERRQDAPFVRAVQKAIQDSTDADGDVAAFLRSLLEQGFFVAELRRRYDGSGCAS